jgi:hypothetical protein
MVAVVIVIIADSQVLTAHHHHQRQQLSTYIDVDDVFDCKIDYCT